MIFEADDEVYVKEIVKDSSSCVWLNAMDEYVGKQFTVLTTSTNNNCMLSNGFSTYYFPREALSLVKTEYVAVTLCIDDFQTKIPLPVDVYDKIVPSTKIQLKL